MQQEIRGISIMKTTKTDKAKKALAKAKEKINALRPSERRVTKQRKAKAIEINPTEYNAVLIKIRELEGQKDKAELQIVKKLAPIKASLGIDKLERQVLDIEEQIDDLWDEKQRFEELVLSELIKGTSVIGFVLRQVVKRFSISYKAICEEIFKDRKDELKEAKEKYGSRKEQYILLFKGEEVCKKDVV